jgi:hypothetical protein
MATSFALRRIECTGFLLVVGGVAVSGICFSFDERSGIAFSKNAGGAVVPRAGVVGVPFRGAPRLDRGERSESGTDGGTG